MTAIDDKIAQIRGASLGSEVRESIASGIELCYANTDKYENATAEVEATLAAGANASVRLVNSSGHKVFKFSIPRGNTGSAGPQGSPGVSPNISMGTVTTVSSSSSASATLTGPQTNLKLNLSLPKGAKGDDGEDAAVGSFALEYSDSSTYSMGSFCTHGAKLYRCTNPITIPKEWDANDWTTARVSRAVMGAARIVDVSKFPDANNAEANRIYVIPSAANQTDSNYVQNLPYAKAIGTLVILGWQTGTGNDAVGSIQLFVSNSNNVYTRYKTGTSSFTAWTNISAQADPLLLLSIFAAPYIEQTGGSYMKGEMVTYNRAFYRAKQDNVQTGTWDSSKWQLTSPIEDLAAQVNGFENNLNLLREYYIPLFDVNKVYRAGSIVRYSGNNSLLYIFRKAHIAGPWDSSEVAAVSYSGGVVFPITEWLLDTWNNFAGQYDPTRTYAVGEYACWNGPYLYRCTTAIATPEVWNSAHWTRVAIGDVVTGLTSSVDLLRNQAFPTFNPTVNYSKDHFVIYNNVTYMFVEDHPAGAWDASHVVAAGHLSGHISNVIRTMAPPYSSTATYMPGDYVTRGSALFCCNTRISEPEAWTSAHWRNTWLMEYWNNAVRTIAYSTFSPTTTYYPGQYVIYDRYIYLCTRSHLGEWDSNDFAQTNIVMGMYNLGASLATQYSPARSYKIDDYCVYNGATYRCIADILAVEPFTLAHWERVNALGVTEEVSSLIAPKFSTAKRYSIGEFCVRNNQLYRFTSPHLEGAWNDNDVEQTNLSDTLSGVSTGVVLKSPNGTRFQLSVANDGTLSASAVE